MNSDYTVIYSPALISKWDISLNLIDTSFTLLLFVSFACFVFYKFKKSKRQWHKKYILKLGCMLAVFILFRVNHDLTEFERVIAENENYTSVRNYQKVLTFSGKLEKLEIVKRTWPGHRLSQPADFLFRLEQVKTQNGNWLYNGGAFSSQSRDPDMPKCFNGSINELLRPYIGYEIKLHYYEFQSSLHDTSTLFSKCLVDVAVKK